MAEPLKNLYTQTRLATLANIVSKQYKPFNETAFLNDVFNQQWPTLELKQRIRHISQSLHKHLPVEYAKQIHILKPVSQEFSGFLALIFPDFVAVYGLDNYVISIDALEHFTQYSSSEFAVRPFIMKYEKQMVQQHLVWAKHPNHHIRRLASEGIRPRLPWATALPQFKKDPTALLPILELLKQDESEYVRKSVANNLNDISKDHADIVLSIVKKWQGLSPETNWIVKHASRGLLKQGHTEALMVFGLNNKLNAVLTKLKISNPKPTIGERFEFSCSITLQEKKAHQVRIEYKLYFMKANGKQSGKIFQIGTYNMKPKEKLEIKRTHAFIDLTTRKHHKGEHKLVIVLNGKETAEVPFILE
jgi:3-methyladenine DNA glycosylase AlkC